MIHSTHPHSKTTLFKIISMAGVAMVLSAFPFAAQAQLKFVTNSGAIVITGYNGAVSDLVIPSSVTRIENTAFDTCVNLVNVSLTNGLLYLGQFSFSSCYSLTNISLPS